MNKNIDIKECIVDRDSFFNIKRFRLGNLNIDRPIRSINAAKTDLNFISNNMKTQLFEFSRFLRKNTLINIYEKNNPNIKKILLGNTKIIENNYFITLTFEFNPLHVSEDIQENRDIIESFLAYYYYYSPLMLLIPNVIVQKTIEIEKKKQNINIMSSKEYLNYVDMAFNFLADRNKKPVFVPLSLRFSMKELRDIALHYVEKQYVNIWIDFEGTSLNKNRAAKIRKFLQIINSKKLFETMIIIATNIRREIQYNIYSEATPASDILASITGANIIGVNREPRRVIENKKISEKEIKKHKARIFDRDTYYYCKIDYYNKIKPKKINDEIKFRLLNSPKFNIAYNTVLTDYEFNR